MSSVPVVSPRQSRLTPRAAIGIVFLCFGVAIGLWGGSVAEVLRRGDIGPSVLGSAFLAFSVASVAGLAVAGRVRRSISLRTRLLVLLAMTGACLVALFQVRSAGALISGLFVFSFLASCVDLVMNSEGVAVENEAGRPVLSGFHGLASLGVGLGSIAGSYVSVTFGLETTAAIALLVYAGAFAAVLNGTPYRGATHPPRTAAVSRLPGSALVILGLIVGTSMACEVAAIMFSAQTLSDQAPALAAYAGVGATAFALFQGIVRMLGDRIRDAFGDSQILAASLAVTCAGFLVVASSSSFVQLALGFAIVGIGTACIVPCGFALAARTPGMAAAAAISILAMVGAAVRVPAPLLYGELAGVAGFAPAFALYAVLAAAALALAFFSVRRARIRRPA
jgi:hypothetical protein